MQPLQCENHVSRFGQGLISHFSIAFWGVDSKLVFYHVLVTFWCPAPGSPNGSQSPSKINKMRTQFEPMVPKGPQEVPSNNFRLIFDGFGRSFGATLEVFLMDLG